MKASTFKVLVQLVLNASEMVYRYQKGFNLQMHYYDNTYVPVWETFFL